MGVADFMAGGSRRGFADRVMRRLRRLGWGEPLRYDPAAFSIELGGAGGTLNLHNIFEECRKEAFWRRTAQIDAALAFVFDPPDLEKADYVDIEALLLPIVRNRSHLAANRFEEGTGADWVDDDLLDAIADHLGVLLVIDRPNSMVILNEAHWTRWGKTRAEVFARAVENLRGLGPSRFEVTGSGFHLSAFNDYFDASRLLLPDMFEALPLRGRPVAIPISRACMVVVGEHDHGGLRAMAGFADFAMKDEVRPISGASLLLEGGVWRRFEPLDEELAPIRVATARQRHADYAVQTDRLQRRLEDVGEDSFVAPLEGRFVGEELFSWTSMARGVPTWLPKADVVVLIDEGSETLCRRWEEIEAVCGLFSPVETVGYPPRYRRELWPTPAQWLRLKSEFAAPPWMQGDPGG